MYAPIKWLRQLCFISLLLVPFLLQAQWTTVGTAGFSAGIASFISMAVNTSGTPYIAFNDGANSNKATCMKYNGSSWVNVGSAGFSFGNVGYVALAIDASGTPYVGYRDVSNGDKASVMKYNGSSWVYVGSAAFTSGIPVKFDMTIDPSGTLYIGYLDNATSNKATVMKFNGSSWVIVGTAGFSAGSINEVSVTTDASGTPYISYADGGNSSKATVMKYNGSSWVTVGTAGFSTNAVGYTSVGVDASGTPYIAFTDGVSSKATVMKYNGSSWVVVGSASFSAGIATYNKIAFNSTATPYHLCRDVGNGSKPTLRKYNGSSWVTVGSGVSTGTGDICSMAITSNDVFYVGYADGSNSSKSTVRTYGNLWTGASSTVWGTGGNWNAGSAPASTDDAIIPTGCTNYPNITSILTPVCNNLIIDPSASVTVGTSGMLSIYGNITKSSSGTFTATSGKIKMAGSSAQNIPASVFSSNTIQDLEISNSSGVTLGGILGLTGTLTPTSGTFTTGGYLTLKSSASATGRIATGSGSYLSGNVTLERYIPGGRRVFRVLGNPTTSALALSNLQDDIYVTGTGGNTMVSMTPKIKTPVLSGSTILPVHPAPGRPSTIFPVILTGPRKED